MPPLTPLVDSQPILAEGVGAADGPSEAGMGGASPAERCLQLQGPESCPSSRPLCTGQGAKQGGRDAGSLVHQAPGGRRAEERKEGELSSPVEHTSRAASWAGKLLGTSCAVHHQAVGSGVTQGSVRGGLQQAQL